MRNKLLAAAAVAAMVTAIVPAQAAKMGIGCNGSNLAKTESGIDTMADGPAKLEAEKVEIPEFRKKFTLKINSLKKSYIFIFRYIVAMLKNKAPGKNFI